MLGFKLIHINPQDRMWGIRNMKISPQSKRDVIAYPCPSIYTLNGDFIMWLIIHGPYIFLESWSSTWTMNRLTYSIGRWSH